jgi:hypothetical protein
MKRNPRPRKYESAAARQAAYKARAEVLEFRAEPKTAASLTSIAQELDVSRSELLLSMVKFALTNHDWARFGLTHKTLPYYQGNPIMATKKASPAQLAARKKFSEMARSGAFKKAKRIADRAKNPIKGEKVFKAGDMVITDKGEIGQVTYLKKQPAGYADVYKLLDVMANDPYKQTFLENGNYINGTRLKAYKKRAAAKTVKQNPSDSVTIRNLTTIKKMRDWFGITTDGLTDNQIKALRNELIVLGYGDFIPGQLPPKVFYNAMNFAKGKVKMNPIAEMREFTVIKWKRGKNTTNGNPVYEFILKDEFGGMHTGKTKPNAGWVYGIGSIDEGDKINAALEETKSGRVYMVDYAKRKSNPVKRSSRSAVMPNPKSKYYSTDYQDISDVKKFYSKPYMTYTVFTSKDGEKWSKYSVAYIDKKLAIAEAKEVAKRAPTHYIKVESKKNMPVYKK